MDLVCMKKLDTKVRNLYNLIFDSKVEIYFFKVNIIPIIAKSDTINKSELQKFKAKIMGELNSNGVQVNLTFLIFLLHFQSIYLNFSDLQISNK